MNLLSSILKIEETPDSISFNMEELEDLATDLISRIQDASKEHDNALLKKLVSDYLKTWKKSQPEEEQGDDEDDKDQDEDTDEEDKGDDDEGNDGQDPPSGKDPKPARDKNEDSQGDEPPPQKG